MTPAGENVRKLRTPDFFTFRTTVLEYAVEASRLRQEDRIIQYAGQNYSVTGEEVPWFY